MKSNPKQKALYLALCILAAIVVWIFVDNFGDNGGLCTTPSGSGTCLSPTPARPC